jgi:hypothetical protein
LIAAAIATGGDSALLIDHQASDEAAANHHPVVVPVIARITSRDPQPPAVALDLGGHALAGQHLDVHVGQHQDMSVIGLGLHAHARGSVALAGPRVAQ